MCFDIIFYKNAWKKTYIFLKSELYLRLKDYNIDEIY